MQLLAIPNVTTLPQKRRGEMSSSSEPLDRKDGNLFMTVQ